MTSPSSSSPTTCSRPTGSPTTSPSCTWATWSSTTAPPPSSARPASNGPGSTSAVPSARRPILKSGLGKPERLAVLAVCGALGAGALTGCETTQEKATAQRAESERILEARAKRQHHGTKSRTSSADGTNSRTQRDRSAHRHPEHDRTARQGRKGEG